MTVLWGSGSQLGAHAGQYHEAPPRRLHNGGRCSGSPRADPKSLIQDTQKGLVAADGAQHVERCKCALLHPRQSRPHPQEQTGAVVARALCRAARPKRSMELIAEPTVMRAKSKLVESIVRQLWLTQQASARHDFGYWMGCSRWSHLGSKGLMSRDHFLSYLT